MEGCSTNGGYVAWIGRPQEGRCTTNDILWNAGAVFYARTTQPQAVMHLETSTNIYGVTTNPYNTDLTPGGSSGGESALVAMRGSILVSLTARESRREIRLTMKGCWGRYRWFNSLSSSQHWHLWLQANTISYG